MGRIVLFLSSLLVYQLCITVNAQNTFIHYNCTNTGQNYTNGSVYQNNLNLIFNKFNLTSSSLRFDNFTAGNASNKVYGIFQCRFDVSLDFCNACIKNATQRIVKECPFNGEAVVWYEKCMLRYANTSIFALYKPGPGKITCSGSNVSNYAEFEPILTKTMNDINQNASSTLAHYAYQEANLTLSTKLYSFAQCTPDLNATDCKRCLDIALFIINNTCSRSEWVMLFGRSCELRYDTTYPILNEVDRSTLPLPPPLPSPAPSSPPTHINGALPPASRKTSLKSAKVKQIAAGVALGLLAVLIVVLSICGYCMRSSKKSNNVPQGPPMGQNHRAGRVG